MKRTGQGKKIRHRNKTHGFRARVGTPVLKRRRAKKRAQLAL